MDMEIRRSDRRGHSDHGWLDSRHTFSFADYFDPAQVGFGHLRVVNEDRVDPGHGFGSHSHGNMEIVSYVLEGGLAHRDTLGTGAVIRPGEIQLMSAGRGVSHSEMNASPTDPVHFLQIWVLPREANTEPGYQQRTLPDRDGLVLLVSPDGRDGSLVIRQDAEIWRLRLPAILAFLLVGMVVGPHSLGWVESTETTETLAELGVVFLLFVIGLELSAERLMTMRRLIFGMGGLQVALSAAALGLVAPHRY